jgi:hypothetical protein
VFHFQELDWLLYFPPEGNKGKYTNYIIQCWTRKNGAPTKRVVRLGEVMECRELEEHYPHTVGFFKSSTDEAADFQPRYMEIRTVHNIDDFWLFLNALNL